jgi:hypothetical protein
MQEFPLWDTRLRRPALAAWPQGLPVPPVDPRRQVGETEDGGGSTRNFGGGAPAAALSIGSGCVFSALPLLMYSMGKFKLVQTETHAESDTTIFAVARRVPAPERRTEVLRTVEC